MNEWAHTDFFESHNKHMLFSVLFYVPHVILQIS